MSTKAQIVKLAILYIIILFSIVTYNTKDWRWCLSAGHHQWLSGSTIKYVNNWLIDGPSNLKFSMVDNPSSIEFPNIQTRHPYISYPPGTIVPLCIIQKIKGGLLTPKFLMLYNIINKFMIMLFLIATLWIITHQFQFSSIYKLSILMLGSSVYLLNRSTIYFHQNVFFADQAVLLPFSIFVFIEILRKKVIRQNLIIILATCQLIIIIWGSATDYLFLLVVFTAWLLSIIQIIADRKKGLPIISKNFSTSLYYYLPLLFVLFLYMLQVYELGLIEILLNKFLFRTGTSEQGALYVKNFFTQFWLGHMANQYSVIAIPLLWIGLFCFIILFILQKLINNNARYIKFFPLFIQNISKQYSLDLVIQANLLFLIPCFLQVYILRNHSVIHDFSALKFSIPLSFLTASFLIFFYLYPFPNSLKIKCSKAIITVLITISSLLSNHYVFNRCYGGMFPQPNYDYEIIGALARKYTNYNTIIFSNEIAAPINPPQLLSYTNKRIYKVKKIPDDICKFVSERHLIGKSQIFFLQHKGKEYISKEYILKKYTISNWELLSLNNNICSF